MSGDREERGRPLGESPTRTTAGTRAGVSRASRSSVDGSELHPGQVIAGRFRIVARLGSGGMGDVYRADDHELGTSVALKFLPAGLASDPVRLERLRNEVRVARQVAHPNVCRVYDIGDADGRPFLSMEYIDGEDLASLLRRIGRLPRDKALELAREICAGVGAAHELGVVHRDLKPANVMIDGRGRARVADFGLASAAEELVDGRDATAGTPAYMAPEQLDGADASQRTDIYALGLVLYELFTGKRAHEATTLPALRERHSTSAPPTSPSELVQGLDPAIERVIMHCLETDPEDRPASAQAVMAALPGGDPLAAMLKAGELPSPELVAASGRRGTLNRAQALRLGLVVLLGSTFALWMGGRHPLDESVGGILPPEVLAHRAEEVLAELGHEIEKVDSAWGFDMDRAVAVALGPAPETERKTLLESERRPVVRFWYRTSPSPMAPWHGSIPGSSVGNLVTPLDPPLAEAGMTLVRLGPRGRLLEVRVVPGSRSGAGGAEREAPLALVARSAGLDSLDAERGDWPGLPAMPGDTTVVWRLAPSEDEESPREIVATFLDGLPTWIRVDPPPPEDREAAASRAGDPLSLVFLGFFLGGALIAALNIRSGRWDRRGAAWLALTAFVLCLASSVFGSHHALSPTQEVRGFFTSIAYAATRALMTWLLYVALEPFIRRLHPRSLVSWSRLLAGRVLDPAVGRDVLIGLTVSALHGFVLMAGIGILGEGRYRVVAYGYSSGENPLSTVTFLAMVLRFPVVVLGSNLGFLLLYVVAKRALGRLHHAAPLVLWGALFLFSFGAFSVTGLDRGTMVLYSVLMATGATFLAVRHGLLAYFAYSFIGQVSSATIVTLDPSSWYFAPTAILSLLIAAMTMYGLWVATDRRLLPSGP